MVKTLDALYKETYPAYPDARVALLNLMKAIGDIMAIHMKKCDITHIVENLGYIGSYYLDYLRTSHATLENISTVSYWVVNTYIPQIISRMAGECDCKRTCVEKYVNEIVNSATQFVKTLKKPGLTFAEVQEAHTKWVDEQRRYAKILIDECGCIPEEEREKVKEKKKVEEERKKREEVRKKKKVK
jgi:hypothetical protein